MRNDRSLVRPVAAWLPAVAASIAPTADQDLSGFWRCFLLLLLLLRERLGLALAFCFVGGLFVRRSGSLCDLAHHFPSVLVGDREETIVAVEFLLHRIREPEGKE